MERADFEQWKPKEVARLLALVEGGRRYYQNLVAMLPVPLIVLTPDRSVVFANRAFRQAFDLRAEDLGRMSIDQILPSERLIEKIRDVHVHGIAQPSFSLEVGERQRRITIVPIRSLDEETEFETLLVVEDASPAAPAGAPPTARPTAPLQQIDQRELTAARNSALQGLSARLAHDLNNPLMIVTGYAEELLLALKKDDPQRSNVDQILEATQRIADLTAQLLQFTRKQANPPQPVDLSGLLAAFKAGQTPVNVQTGKPVWALADAAQLREILLTVVSAACEGAAEPRATIACDTVSQPSTSARITVSGNGRALDANQRAAIFEAFLAKDPEKSIGAALARAYSIVREWGGDLSVSGDATFALYLPLGTPAASPQRETILVVDDEANIRTLVAKILRRERYNVLQAGSAEEAFAVASAHEGPIHLLITDVVLPGESGRHIAERMRQSLPNLRVLYISGFSDDESVRTGNFPPGSKYLQKPFALGALISKVREALET